MNEIGPPLKIWFYTIGIVTFILLGFTFYSYFPNSPYKKQFAGTHKLLKKAIIENNMPSTSGTTIVFLGSSLTRCALGNNIEIEKDLTKKGHKEFHVLKIPVSALSYEIAEEIRFFEYISKYPPAYLFIENNNINIDTENKDNLAFYIKRSLEQITSLTKNIFRQNNDNQLKIYLNIKPAPLGLFYKNEFDTTIYSELLLKKRFIRTFSQNEIANKAYSEMTKKNTKIIFLDMPLAPKLTSIYIDKKQKTELNNLLENYRQNYGINCWKYPESMYNSDFSDGAHLNHKGAKKYQEWFVSKFDSIK